MAKRKLLLYLIPLITCLAGCGTQVGEADQVVFGHIYTMDDKDTVVDALAVKDGKILKLGNKDEISKLIGKNTKTLDYKDYYVYPGFLDAHTHTMFAGYRAIGQANLSEVVKPSRTEYKKIIQEFINKHPEKDKYIASGWVEGSGEAMDRAFLDEVCKDKPLVLNTAGGHSILLNTKALQVFGIDQAYARKWGPSLVHVDDKGDPTGYICENPAVEILGKYEVSVDDAKEYITWFQDFALSNGITGVSDAGTELMSPNAVPAYIELQKEEKLPLRTYAYMLIKDNLDDPKGKIQEIVEFKNENSGEYFNVVGAKVFLDGVLEARTAWLIEDYKDCKPGETYHGLERFNDKNKMVELITEASKNNLAVHSHSIGDGATKFFLDCISESQKTTKNKDQRNAASHLQLVRKEDIQRFADTNTIAVVPPLWTAKTSASELEIKYIEGKFKETYPIQSFIDKGVKTAFHTDYPVSPVFNIPLSVYMANKRCIPGGIIEGVGGEKSVNNINEAINRKDAILSMTRNVAYMWHQEDRIGSLEVGKIANMSVFDMDLIKCDVEYLPYTSVIATVIDGKEVFKGKSYAKEELLKYIYQYLLEIIYGQRYDWDDDPSWLDYLLG